MEQTTTTQPTTDPHPDLHDPRPAMAQAFEVASTVVRGVRADQLDLPTPCDDMDVRGLLGHLIMVAQRIACAGRKDPTASFPGEREGLADDEWASEWEREAAVALDPWLADDDLLDAMVELPWATLPGSAVLGTYVNEVLVHAWDLATATAQAPVWPADAVALGHAAIVQQLPMADRTELWAEASAALPPSVPWSDPFKGAVPVPDDAPAIERLVAWNGRQI